MIIVLLMSKLVHQKSACCFSKILRLIIQWKIVTEMKSSFYLKSNFMTVMNILLRRNLKSHLSSIGNKSLVT